VLAVYVEELTDGEITVPPLSNRVAVRFEKETLPPPEKSWIEFSRALELETLKENDPVTDPLTVVIIISLEPVVETRSALVFPPNRRAATVANTLANFDFM